MEGIKYLLKFGKRTHVEEFVGGSMYCSDAVTLWGIEDKLKIKGQGDILEAGARMFAQRFTAIEHETNNVMVFNKKADILTHIKPAEHIPVFCLFSVRNNDCQLDGNGNVIINLPRHVKDTIRSHFPQADAVAVIKDPDGFIQDVTKSIGCEIKHENVQYFHIDKGLEANDGKDTAIDMEFMMYLVQDTPPTIEKGKTTYSFCADYAYRILFCKDVFFTDEQEYRIILPNEKISSGTKYPVTINQKIDILTLDEFLQ